MPRPWGAPFFRGGYALILWAAMLTTALANANALAGRLTFLKAPWRGVALCLAAHPWTTVGFSRLIALFYPPLRLSGAPSVGSAFHQAMAIKRSGR